MNDELRLLARKLLAESQTWGSAVEAGIRSGSFDNGELILPYRKKAEQQLIRNRKELIEGDAA
jgi:hypothetical protein